MANNIEIILVAVDLLSLKLLIFRLIISYFGSLRMHQTAPLISFFLGEHAPGPHTPSFNPHPCRADFYLHFKEC